MHVGRRGDGSMIKLVNNTLAAVNAATLAEALHLARAAGLDLDAMLRVVAAGSGASAMLDLKARPMLDHDFEPLFKLDHMLKDVRHCLEEARGRGVPSASPRPRSASTRASLRRARGGSGSDFAAVMEVAGRGGALGNPAPIS